MEKYTVDLDKVLNDFEYSEYSSESAKSNRLVPEDIPNTSLNSNYSVRTETPVKHSINNVFHSLNEYLSSDITPKKIETGPKIIKECDIQKSLHSTTYLKTVDTENLNPFTNNLLGKTDNISINVIPNPNIKTEDISTVRIEENGTDSCSSYEVSTFEALKNVENQNVSEISENLLEIKDNLQDIVDSSKDSNVSEEVLLNLDCNTNNCDKKSLDVAVENRGEGISRNNTLADELMTMGPFKEVVNTEEKIETNVEGTRSSKENLVPVQNEDIIEEYDEGQSVELENVEQCEKSLIKIGFKSDVNLDEENLDVYFQELEKELGHQLEESDISEKIAQEENKGNVVVPAPNKVENHFGFQKNEELNEYNEIVLEEKEILPPKLDSGENTNSLGPISSEENIEPKLQTVSSSNPSESIPIKDENETRSFVVEQLETNTSSNSENSITEINKSIKQEEKKEAIAQTSITNELIPEEFEQLTEKNHRPQHLILAEETQDNTRKINLIGEPGSTPYNNAYSTKDFGRGENQKDSKDQDIARATSPTYSDISTDSVSNSTSDDVEYNDAISEIEEEKPKVGTNSLSLITDANKEMLQNNMVSSLETCRNDVTMDKDFKNNLKTNNIEDSSVPGVSNITKETTDEPSNSTTNVEGDANEHHSDRSNNDTEEVSNIELRTGMEDSILDKSTGFGMDWLGKQAPLWIPDNEAMTCLHCDVKFTVIKRRHHCRACGLVLCSKCCNLKYRLEYLDADARVCNKCYDILNKDTNSSSGSEISQEASSPTRSANQDCLVLAQPNPNNPLEYCSTLPPLQQVDAGATATPSVMVPVGVLKRSGSTKARSTKSVMFCDGIRPGSDLTALDKDFNYTDGQKAEKSKKSPEKSGKIGRNSDLVDPETRSFIPSDVKNLPPTITIFKSDVKYSPCANNENVVEMLRNETLIFAIQANVYVHVRIINMDCCVNKTVWCFSTEGLINVGQDELVILLETVKNESLVPRDLFVHLNNIYLEAVKGSSVKELGLSLHTSSPFLGSKNHAGFVYIRPTYQCLQNVIIPKEPYLVGILIHRWETPWAKLFPLRLVLRLGAEYKYYPSPIISTRDRDSVFVEIGHTIINLLADFRNFSYTLPQIRGLTIHMEDKKTTISIPINRFDQVMKGLFNSSDHILAFAGNFSMKADSHLVCIQDTQSATNNNYSTHAINICSQPRKVTGASFIVFNGALKSSSGLTAKSNIVEDGLMIQILPEHMLQVRESLRNMKDHTIKCGCVNEESDESVSIVWGEPDTTFNVGVASPIDNKIMTGIPSIRVHNGKDYACNSKTRLIRWTEVFIIQSDEESNRNQDPVDISKISESVAKATCQALVKYLDLLVSNSFYKIGLRANLHIENVSYSAGSNNVKLPPIYMKSLDNELIPVLHRITSNNITEQPIILELIFRILNI